MYFCRGSWKKLARLLENIYYNYNFYLSDRADEASHITEAASNVGRAFDRASGTQPQHSIHFHFEAELQIPDVSNNNLC